MGHTTHTAALTYPRELLGVVAASAPVRDHTGRVVAAINVSAPKGRIAGHLDRLGIYVARAADRLSEHLGALHNPHA